MNGILETCGYARAGLLGNPSDGYFGKTISFAFTNFRARVLVYPSARLEIRLAKADLPIFENLEDLYRTTRWRGYYGGVRILQALIVRFSDYCRQQGIGLEDRNFTIEYESNIPQRLGLGGSSAIITAALNGLCQHYGVEIPIQVRANLALEAETRELGVPAGLQDRVIQAYGGLVYMDFSKEILDRQGYGDYTRLDPKLLPPVYVAYRTSLSEGTEVFHNNVRERWRAGDPEVVEAMKTWAGFAERGRAALEARDYDALDRLMNANFDLRAKIYKISQGNLEMIEAARRAGATAKFAGSGGAIVGTYEDEAMYRRLERELASIGVAVVKPKISPEQPRLLV
ncbi:MAG: GHMP kinase, partial [Acidobacteria bacterium]|nr:GHMP kinase [Acidobacteriota bacterium]